MIVVDSRQAHLNANVADGLQATSGSNVHNSPQPSLPGVEDATRQFDSNASIVLVGVRGAGKRSLGFIAATHLGRRFVSEGLYFETVAGTSKAAYLQQHGKVQFYQRTLEVFQKMLETNDRDSVIECGMASFTTQAQELLRLYARTHPVIHVVRNFDHIAQHLRLDRQQMEQLSEADLGHRTCSNSEFYNLYDCTCLAETEVEVKDFSPSSAFVLQDVKMDFQNFVDFVSRKPKVNLSGPFSLSAISLEQKSHSYVTTLQLSELLADSVNLGSLESGEDAIELVVDGWTPNIRSVISKQVSSLKRRVSIPIILSVSEKGLESLKLKAVAYSEMIEHAFRIGVDYVAIDGTLPEQSQRRLLRSKGNTKAIADHRFQDPAPRAWLEPVRITICEGAQKVGYDIVRLRQTASERQDNADVEHFRRIASERVSLPIIAYNEGCYGKTSKVFNRIMTPVEHRAVATEAITVDPTGGKIWVRDAIAALFRCFEYDRLHFYVLGQSVFFSRSPAMYNAAYQLYNMDHDFSYRDVSTFGEILDITKDNFFGGAAISFPFKEEAFNACSATSPHASVVGSVNTILPLRQLVGQKTGSLSEQANQRNKAGPVVGLYGDNNDWEGLYRTLQRKMSPRNAATRMRSTGLVLGAGGSARSSIYALLRLGCQTVYVYNRTYEHAVKVADHFNAWIAEKNRRQSVRVLKPGELTWPNDANVPTMIVACVPTTTASFDGRIGQTFSLPEEWLGSPSGGVVADISYNPPSTPFLEQVRQLRETRGKPWAIVTGVELVYEQAILQFEQMTGYRAPRATMRKVLTD